MSIEKDNPAHSCAVGIAKRTLSSDPSETCGCGCSVEIERLNVENTFYRTEINKIRQIVAASRGGQQKAEAMLAELVLMNFPALHN